MRTQSLRERLRESTWMAIVDAAEAVGATDGLAATSLQSIAQKAGIAVGTIYNYFADRNELIEALFTRRREEFIKAVDAAMKAQVKGSFEAQLEAFVRAVLKYFDHRRAFLRLALEVADPGSPSGMKGTDAKRRPTTVQLRKHAERIVRVGTKEKRLRSDGEQLFAAVLVSILKGVLFERAAEEASLESETAVVVSLFLHGVAR
jgi:AcrR family transcriptional regulator